MKTVFFGPNSSVVKWAYTDVIKSNDIEYCEFPEVKGKLNKLLLTRRGASKVPFCMKRRIYSRILKYDFLKSADRNDEHLFVFTCQNNMFFTTFFSAFIVYLKRLFKKSKFAFYYYDLIKTCAPEKIEQVKELFDVVYTFDSSDADEYGITFYGEICAKNEPEENDITPFTYLYVGCDRGRFDTIISVFDKLSNLNNEDKCVFYINDVLPENVIKIKERYGEYITDLAEKKGKIEYNGSVLYFNHYSPYVNTLKYIYKCKCMVEIVFPGQTAGTMRLPESAIYKKKLITNCDFVLSRKDIYNPNNILVFSSVDDINKKNISKLKNSEYEDMPHDFSTFAFIERVKKDLNI